jgi:hypothetical protein
MLADAEAGPAACLPYGSAAAVLITQAAGELQAIAGKLRDIVPLADEEETPTEPPSCVALNPGPFLPEQSGPRTCGSGLIEKSRPNMTTTPSPA